jgi:hypothetical protein
VNNQSGEIRVTDAPGGGFRAGQFRVGNVFSLSWSVLSRNFLTFMLVTGVASLPDLLMGQLSAAAQGNAFASPGPTIFLFLLLIVLGTLSQAIVLHGAFQVMRGLPIDLVESARIGLRRFIPLVGLALSMSLFLGLATALLVIPGLILYVMWFVATPVCVVEQLGPFRSLGRSRQLTKGYRWKILGLQLVILIPVFVVGAILGGLTAVILGPTFGPIVNLLWSAIWTAFLAIVLAVTYHDLRVAKEGVDTEQIAAVFE